jgi:hypothetical protein
LSRQTLASCRPVHDRFGQADRARMLQDSTCRQWLDHLRMAVPQRVDAHAGVEVHVAAARGIVHIDPLAARPARPYRNGTSRNQVLLFLARIACGPMGSCSGNSSSLSPSGTGTRDRR